MSFAKAFKKKGWITEKIAQKLDNVRFVIHDFRLRPKHHLPADEKNWKNSLRKEIDSFIWLLRVFDTHLRLYEKILFPARHSLSA